jgi:hypothetical protein
LFAIITFSGMVFLMRTVPETKGKTLEDIEISWKH